MVLIAIYNPVSGDRSAKSFFHHHILPLFTNYAVHINDVYATEYAGHAGKIVRDTILKYGGHDVQVVLCAGDGTLHEIVNYLSPAPDPGELNRIKFILVPCGTANALYSSLFPPNLWHSTDPTYKLQSIYTYLNTSRIRPLSTVINTINSSTPSIEVLSMVVTSTCMHASILRDSEKLRTEFPGVDRYKIAAQRNSNQWYSGHAKLFPLNGKPVQIFEPILGHFVDHPEAIAEKPIVELNGPFVYFVSVVNVDRLEPTYVIAPSVEQASDPAGSCKLVIIRPSRDPAFRANDETGRAAFVAKLWETLISPFEKGAHIHLRYDAEGGIISTDGQGPPVVEYFQCGGWEWYPDQTDEHAHLLCSDGATYQIPRGGSLASFIESARNRIEFAVYA